MNGFGSELRRLRDARGLSQPALAKLVHVDPSLVSKWENHARLPTAVQAESLDAVLGADGVLIELAKPRLPATIPGPEGDDPWETSELIRRFELSDVGDGTIERIQATTERLCCQYEHANAAKLRTEAHQWLRYTAQMLQRSVTLAQHRELLVSAGWLSLLVGCLEHDLGMPSAAEATRMGAASLGRAAGHSEIEGWAWEMRAWMALTANDPEQVVYAARAGQEVCSRHSVAGQMAGLEAKGLARLGRGDEVHAVMDRGFDVLEAQPPTVRSSNHFVVDASKHTFLAMDVYRVAGDDRRAVEAAQSVLRKHVLPDGSTRSPMRVAEARMTLAVAAARAGELDAAIAEARTALGIERQSVPSLWLPARELLTALGERYPASPEVRAFDAELRARIAA